MVILIAGAGCVGKTFMAQKILEIYKIPYLSIDHLKMGLYRSGLDYGFTPESEDVIITEKLWPIIKEIIKTNIENEQSIIIEGCYFPNKIDDMDKEYLDKIIMFCIVFSEDYIRKNIWSKIYDNRNAIENRKHGFIKDTDIEKYIFENRIRKQDYENNGIKCFEINQDYEREIADAYLWIDNEIKSKAK